MEIDKQINEYRNINMYVYIYIDIGKEILAGWVLSGMSWHLGSQIIYAHALFFCQPRSIHFKSQKSLTQRPRTPECGRGNKGVWKGAGNQKKHAGRPLIHGGFWPGVFWIETWRVRMWLIGFRDTGKRSGPWWHEPLPLGDIYAPNGVCAKRPKVCIYIYIVLQYMQKGIYILFSCKYYIHSLYIYIYWFIYLFITRNWKGLTIQNTCISQSYPQGQPLHIYIHTFTYTHTYVYIHMFATLLPIFPAVFIYIYIYKYISIGGSAKRAWTHGAPPSFSGGQLRGTKTGKPIQNQSLIWNGVFLSFLGTAGPLWCSGEMEKGCPLSYEQDVVLCYQEW